MTFHVDQDLQRKQFEGWLLDVHGLVATWNQTRNSYDQYAAHLAFQAWQAAQGQKPSAGTQDPISGR